MASDPFDDQRDIPSLLLPLRRQGQRSPLFCIHPGGGLAWPYARLVPYLDPDVPVYGLQSRGICMDQDQAPSIESMAADYIDQMMTVQPGGPYYLLGWSLGAAVAHAIATQLQARGEKVALLALLDGYPDSSSAQPPSCSGITEMSDAEIMQELIKALSAQPCAADDMPTSLGQIRQWLEQTDHMLAGLDEPLLKRILHEVRDAPRLMQEFDPGLFQGDMLFFRATSGEQGNDGLPSVTSWQPYVSGRISIHDIACQHMAMMQPEALADIAPVVAAALNDSRGVTNSTGSSQPSSSQSSLPQPSLPQPLSNMEYSS
ncbi:alpha/beta fold hydrolase [Halomonas binhaiensis]|uniref:Alpha/beta fold hydrolase n=2 Tax=Halomonas binhaiensis TaxID=2562282 RepID=A0A7U3K5K9_9GAMM|nr:alpha/beta fold hydrolase [Halomonas binhaiensis]